MRRLAALAMLLSVPALADDEGEGQRAADASLLAACVAEVAPEPTGLSEEVRAVEAACIGRVSEPCMAAEDGGYSTLGMSLCAQRETDAWDVLLNDDWPGLMARARAVDTDNEGWPQELPSAAEALRAAQRAWLAWRKAECRSAYADWGAGSMRHIAGTGCMLRLTAERTIAFRLRLRAEP